ncbi:hypothetical protein EDL79_04715 [Ehrlichia ruminantium]|uniref:Uncharacterized protein n=1 Tax=Ehrlichia ruminantium TaxID=779 RepID=A0AAE6QBC1_EHRRU|nr:hypothetical protein [Ehrlichia ruminantium]QGR02904.1 hypothetical protein EDL81_04700 [Ehrlichia ruminantium]QGR03828.1 hypothetical protein EDL80_04705 [Ehrlichia ruminantium]QGR04755.1 hypothetical protein EDL79_04715 [Ehrlichia ruminantium]
MGIIPQLDITSYPSQLFWFFLSFGILYLIVSKNVLPKIENIVRNRYNITRGAISSVEEDLNHAQQELDRQLLKLNEVQLEVDRIINSALKEVQDANENLMVMLNQEIQSMFKMADDSLKDMKHQLEQQLIGLAFDIALVYHNKLLGIDCADKNKLRDITIKVYKERI